MQDLSACLPHSLSLFLSVFLYGCGVCGWNCDMGQAFWPQHAHNVHMAAKIYLQLCWDIIPFDRLRATTPAHLQSLSISLSASFYLYLCLFWLALRSAAKWWFFWLWLSFHAPLSSAWLQLSCANGAARGSGGCVKGGKGRRGGLAVAETMCWIICAIYVALISLWDNESEKELRRAES